MDPAGVMVRVDGSDDEGDGSEERPYQTLARAHMTGATNISLGPGEFAGSYDFGYSETFSLTGCGPGETFIVADESVQPAIDIESLYLTLRGFTARGGTVGLSIFGPRELTLEQVDVEESFNIGITLNTALDATLRHINISNIQPSSAMDSTGVSLVNIEALDVQDLSVRSMAAGIGILTGGAAGTFQRVDVSEINGVGAHLNSSSITWTGGSVTNIQGIGIAVSSPGERTFNNLTVSDITPGDRGSGDGIGVWTSGSDPIESRVLRINNSTVTNTARAGVIVSNTIGDLNGNTVEDCAFPVCVFAQEGAQMIGSDEYIEAEKPFTFP
ncbi:hypothetical protein L6R49_08385 [Myxococcota bacterium]|nr:hypothetical protein [Myxococcota bacterium]